MAGNESTETPVEEGFDQTEDLTKKTALVDHISRVHCGGRIHKAVFSGRFGAVGHSRSLDLMVIAPELSDAVALPHALSIPDLNRVGRLIKNEPRELLDLTYDPALCRLVLKRGDGCVFFCTEEQDPELVMALERTAAQSLEQLASSDDTVWLTHGVAQAVIEGIRLLKPSLVSLQVEAEGSQFVITDGSNLIEIPHPDLWSDEPYWVLLNAKTFRAVLSQVDRFTECTLQPTGPDTVVAVCCGEYRYLLAACAYDSTYQQVRRLVRLARRHDSLRSGTDDADGEEAPR